MVVLQALSQACAVWKAEGRALVFTDAAVVLGRVPDKGICETMSRKCGPWDCPVQNVCDQRGAGWLSTAQSTACQSRTTRREARIPPDRVTAIPFGQALVIVGTGWEYVPIQLYDHHLGFRQVLPDGRQTLARPAPTCAPSQTISSEADA